MPGDTGIAIHPSDGRYCHLVGKKARHHFVPGRLLLIVADDYVDIRSSVQECQNYARSQRQ
jgi:valyl-tRNA synthetase